MIFRTSKARTFYFGQAVGVGVAYRAGLLSNKVNLTIFNGNVEMVIARFSLNSICAHAFYGIGTGIELGLEVTAVWQDSNDISGNQDFLIDSAAYVICVSKEVDRCAIVACCGWSFVVGLAFKRNSGACLE